MYSVEYYDRVELVTKWGEKKSEVMKKEERRGDHRMIFSPLLRVRNEGLVYYCE